MESLLLSFLLCFLFSSLPHLLFSFSSLLSPSPSGRLGLSVPLSLPNHQGPSTLGETGPCDAEQDAAQTASEGMLALALGAGQCCQQPARGLLVRPGSTRHSQSSRPTVVPVLPRLAVCACAWASVPSPLLAPMTPVTLDVAGWTQVWLGLHLPLLADRWRLAAPPSASALRPEVETCPPGCMRRG